MKNYVIALAIAILCLGCNIGDLEFDNIKDLEYSPSAAIPLGAASYGIKELIEDLDDDQLIIDEDAELFLSLMYVNNSSFSVSTDFVDFDDIENSVSYNLGLPDTPPSLVNRTEPIDPVVFTFEFPEKTGSDLIDSIFYSLANLRIRLLSNFEGDIDYTVTLLGTKAFGSDEDVSYTSSVDGNSIDIIESPLANHRTILDNSSGQNQFEFLLQGTINIPQGTQTSVNDRLDIDVTIADIEVSEIYGQFGKTEVEIQDQSINLDGFQDFSSTGLVFGDPKIKLEVNNSYGIPILLDVSGLVAENSDGGLIQLSGDIATSGINIAQAPSKGQIALTESEFSKENSNIDEILNSTPIRIDIPIQGTTNPDGPPSAGTNNFLIDGSKIDVKATVETPLNFQMSGFSTEVDFDISDIDIDDAVSMSLRVVTINQLPLDAVVNFQILNAANTVLHEIPDVVLLATPNVEPDGRVSEPARSVEDIELSQAGIDAFVNGNTIVAQLDVTTFNAQGDAFVRIFSDYRLEFQLSFLGEFTTTIEFN